MAMVDGYSSIEYLNLALHDENPMVRTAAIDSLGDIGDDRAIGVIQQALHDKDPAVRERALEVIDEMQHAIVAFQFYDKLSQRLNHLSNGLAAFARLLDNPERMRDPQAWDDLQDDIKAKYTLESDRAMFDAILAGKSVEEVLQNLTAAEENPADEIELF